MLSGISIWQLLIVLVIVVMIFGTKKLRNMGSDLGGAVKGFKKALDEDPTAEKDSDKNLSHEKVEQDAEFASQEDSEKEKQQDKA